MGWLSAVEFQVGVFATPDCCDGRAGCIDGSARLFHISRISTPWLNRETLWRRQSQLDGSFRVMVFLDAASGLRRSELLALKWGDIDFDELQINVRRSIYLNVVGNCKTEASRKPVPMDLILASALWSWKQDSPYGHADDWVFASPHTRGRNPYWPDSLLSHVIRPAAVRAGIGKHIGWHTFRHSFSTMLIANGENVKVVQELMRHANCRCTLEVYSQARIQANRSALHRVVEMIFPQEREVTATQEHAPNRWMSMEGLLK